MSTAPSTNISVNGTTKIINAPIAISEDDGRNLWQMTVENGEKSALIYFKTTTSDDVTKRIGELLKGGAELRFYGTVDYDKVMVTEMYLNLKDIIDVLG